MFKIIEHLSLEPSQFPFYGRPSSGLTLLNTEERARLEGTMCIEVRIDDLREEAARYRLVDAQFDLIVSALIKTSRRRGYLITLSHPSEKSRIKSHKGMFAPKSTIRDGAFLQKELELDSESYFLGVVQIDPHNYVESLGLGHNRLRSLLLISSTDQVEEVAGMVVRDIQFLVCRGALFFVDVLHFLARTRREDDVLLTFGGDVAGGNWLNLCLFVPKRERRYWFKTVGDCSRDAQERDAETASGPELT